MSNPSLPASDREIVDLLIKHIDNPCEITIDGTFVANVREVYLREAKRLYPNLTDLIAQKDLGKKIQEYDPDYVLLP